MRRISVSVWSRIASDGASAEDQVGFCAAFFPLPEPSLSCIPWPLRAALVWICTCGKDAQSTGSASRCNDGTDRVQTMKQIGNWLSLHNERQNQVLGAHLGKSIADDLIGGRWHLQSGGERRTLSIVFADIRDFTPWEQNHPEAVFRTLNGTYRRCWNRSNSSAEPSTKLSVIR